MKNTAKSLHISLFSRTFLLLSILIAINVIIWVQAIQNIANNKEISKSAQISLIVNDVHAVLSHATLENLPTEIQNLEQKYDIAISSDFIKQHNFEFVNANYVKGLHNFRLEFIKQQISNLETSRWTYGEKPRFWARLTINHEYYWIGFDPNLIQPAQDIQWLAWLGTAIMVSLLGAVFIVRLINMPVLRLANAATLLMQGKKPPPLPEIGSDEIRTMNTRFNQMVEQLTQAETDRTLMLAGISHDLRTPLTRIRLELEMQNLSDEIRLAIEEDLEQIDRTIKQFMDYARPQNELPKVINITMPLREIASREILYTKQVNGELHYSISENLLTRVNQSDLERIVTNIIENARRYAYQPDRTLKIYLIAYQTLKHVVIDISDNGPGIESEKHQTMLQPFVRGSNARSNTGGTGLGLAIVNRLIQRVGGELRLGASSMDGFKVSIRFPIAK